MTFRFFSWSLFVDLSNARGGSLCNIHHIMLASKWLVWGCGNRRLERTLACQEHQPEWRKHAKNSKRHNQAGVHWMLQHPGENNPWEPNHRGPNPQQHDDPNAEPRETPNSVQVDSIVLKLSLHLVVLLLLGQSFLNQNHQQIV